MSKLTIFPLVALLTTTACAADLSGDDDDGAPPPAEAVPVAPAPSPTDCETAAPDASFVGSPMVLGIVVDASAAIVKLDARVFVDGSGEHFTIEMQPQDPETGAPIGEPQQVRDIAIDAEGLFSIEELVLELPPGALPPVEDEPVEDGQTALAEVRGGFCTHTGSLQGTYEGWTFTPTAERAAGVWFVAPMEAP